jgi:ABC-type Fe3+-siderophore transport system permease subunit
MPLSRIAWLVTVVACLITAAILLISGYVGYFAIAIAIAISAAINLR